MALSTLQAQAFGRKGGNTTKARHGRKHYVTIGKLGWHQLVAKVFHGDYHRAGMWLSRNGLRAQDPVPENGAWQGRQYEPFEVKVERPFWSYPETQATFSEAELDALGW